MFLGLVLLLTLGLIGTKNVQANNSKDASNVKVCTLSTDVQGNAEVYVIDVKYNYSNGYVVSYTVKLRLIPDEYRRYRIKVTPKDKITGAVVEAAQYTELTTKQIVETEVTFHCNVTKNGDAAYCAAYDFIAEIVN